MAPWDGSGNYNRTDGTRTGARVWQDARDAGVNIRADAADEHDNDFGNALENCIARNGENSPTANLPMANYRHTGVSDATADDQYAALGQVKTLITPAIVVLTPAASVTWDLSGKKQEVASLEMDRNIVLNITGATDGGIYGLWTRQDATGGRTLTFPGSAVLDTGSLTGAIDADANEITFLTLQHIFGKLRLTVQRTDYSN